MTRLRSLAAAVAAAVLVTVTAARADDPPLPTPMSALTHHSLELDGKSLRYTADAERITLRNATNDPAVSMFSTAYLLDGADARKRPVAFLWNGGPGSSTLWLHMGSFAPVRVATNGTGTIVPPAHLVDNTDGTLLGATDLVFIDAPGTGYSRIGGKGKTTDYYGVDQDARAFTAFIERWLTVHDRWGSPKYLIGESYGTTRAANVVDRLQIAGIGVNGVVLISSALNYAGLDPALPGDDTSNVAFLPSEAAVAWYHHALPSPQPPELAPFLREVRAFARGAYVAALMQGDQLDAATRRDITARLHAYTGLDPAYIDRANLRIDPTRFEKELLRPDGELTGRLDGRFTGFDQDRNSDSPSYDPTLDASIQDAFVGEFNRYIRDDLHFRTDDRYLPDNYSGTSSWDFRRDARDVGFDYLPQTNVLPDLAQALTRNPALHVFSANGYFDLATPFFGTEMDLHDLGLAPKLQPHVEFGFYPSGHMIYLESASRRLLRDDLARFIGRTLPTG